MVFIYHCTPGKLGHTHDTVGMIHTVLLDRIDSRIDFSARTVKIRSMHMDTKRFAAHHLGVHTGRISQPVMRMNNVELLLTGYYSGNNRKIVDFLVQISRITSCKLHTSQIIDMHIGEIGINMVAERIIFFR